MINLFYNQSQTFSENEAMCKIPNELGANGLPRVLKDKFVRNSYRIEKIQVNSDVTRLEDYRQ